MESLGNVIGDYAGNEHGDVDATISDDIVSGDADACLSNQ